MTPIKILRARGANAVGTVNIFNTSVSASGAHSAIAKYNLLSSGAGSGTGISGWTWLVVGLNSYFQVRATVLSGDTPTNGDSLGAWLSMNTNRSWGLDAASSGDSFSCNLLVEIKRIADGAIIDSATITISVSVA